MTPSWMLSSDLRLRGVRAVRMPSSRLPSALHGCLSEPPNRWKPSRQSVNAKVCAAKDIFTQTVVIKLYIGYVKEFGDKYWKPSRQSVNTKICAKGCFGVLNLLLFTNLGQ